MVRRLVLGSVAIFLLVIAAYSPAFHGAFLWDDDFYVSANSAVQDGGWGGLRRIWTDTGTAPQYYPMTFTSYWIEHHLWGLDTFGYHVVNALLHASTALLLWRILVLLEVPGAWLAAAIFAVHPIQVESVAWITERKNTLSGLFYMLAAWTYLRSALPARGLSPSCRRSAPVASALLFVAALLSKSVTASLPVVLALVLIWKKGRLERRHFLPLGLMVAAGAAKGIVTAFLEVAQVGAQGADWALGPLDRVVVAGRIFWFYLGKLACPAGLSFSYERWAPDAAAVGWWAFPIAVAALLAGLLALRGRLGSGPLVAVLFYGITLSPALGFLNVYPMRYSFVADHFQYLAGIGPIALLAAGWARIGAWHGPSRGTAWRAVAAALVLALAATSWRYSHAFADLETLWRDSLGKSPRSWLASYNLGKILVAQGRLDEGLVLIRRTIDLKPDHVDAYSDVANALLDRGDLAGAMALYEKGISIDPSWPPTHYNLAVALEAAGDPERAEVEYRKAIRLAPSVAHRYRGGIPPLPWQAHLGLGRLLLRQARPDDAAAEFRRGLVANPGASELYLGLANLLADRGRHDEAIEVLRTGASTAPPSAPIRYNLGLLLESIGDLSGAAGEYRAATAIDRSFGAAYNNLAIVLYRTGDDLGAWAALREAVRLGVSPHPEFIRVLSRRTPDPESSRRLP